MKKVKTALVGILELGRVLLVEMDNASFASIRAAEATILTRSNNRVNILVNAGVMGIAELKLTEDGYESHFATNHLSHFLLFQLLKPALFTSSTPEFHSRIVIVASSAHYACNLNESDNYNFQKGGYNHGQAYEYSKLANVWMTNELTGSSLRPQRASCGKSPPRRNQHRPFQTLGEGILEIDYERREDSQESS